MTFILDQMFYKNGELIDSAVQIIAKFLDFRVELLNKITGLEIIED